MRAGDLERKQRKTAAVCTQIGSPGGSVGKSTGLVGVLGVRKQPVCRILVLDQFLNGGAQFGGKALFLCLSSMPVQSGRAAIT